MIAPRKPEPEAEQPDDDLGLDLEDHEDSLAGDDPGFEPEGDDDLELDDTEEVIGLDSQTGLGDESDDEDDDALAADDEASWLDEAPAEELAADDDLAEDSERWTEGSEPDDDESFDDDLEVSEEGASGEDTGAEGFDDEQLLNGLDVERLPALDRRGAEDEEGADPIERELLDELVAAVAEESPSVGAPSAVWTRLREGAPPQLLAAASELCAAWDAGLWLARTSDATLTKQATLGGVAYGLALCEARGAIHLALATPKGACVSRDGGHVFGAPLPTSERGAAAAYVAFTRDAGGSVLWAAAPFGRLLVLREGGDELVDAGLELPVAKLASDGAQALLVLGRSDDGALRAVLTTDGGRSFKPLALPADSVERVQTVAVAGDTWTCSRRGLRPQLVWGRRGEAGLPLTPNATPPIALLVERGTPCAYLCETDGDHAALLRVELRGKHAAAVPIAPLPKDLGTPLLLVASRDLAGNSVIHVAGTRALYRAQLTSATSDS